jgi:hypothetical protein
MYSQVNPNEMPGVGSSTLSLNRAVWLGRAGVQYLPGGGSIDGNNARDPSNTLGLWEAGQSLPQGAGRTTAGAMPGTLQAGLLMAKADTGLYAASVLGLTTAGFNASGLSLTVAAATAAEIARRIGATGTINLIGPPTANTGNSAQVAIQALAYSAIDTTSGVLTISTGNAAAAVAGSIVAANDGSQVPTTFIDELDGIRVTDANGNGITVQFPRIPIAGGVVNTASLVNYPADTGLQAWLKAQLNTSGSFRFSDNY